MTLVLFHFPLLFVYIPSNYFLIADCDRKSLTKVKVKNEICSAEHSFGTNS